MFQPFPFAVPFSANAAHLRQRAGILRSQYVRVNVTPFGQPADSHTSNGSMLQLNLFSDLSVTADNDQVHHIIKGNSGFTWSGHVHNEPFSEVVLTVCGGLVIGHVQTQGKMYEIGYLGNNVEYIAAIDPKYKISESMPLTRPKGIKSPNARPELVGTMDDGSTIDIMILYTPAARDQAGGDTAIQNEIASAAVTTNLGYTNSQIATHMDAVYVGLENYTESGNMKTDLENLANGTGGMTDVLPLRDQYGADLVSLIAKIEPALCGIGFLMPSGSTASSAESLGYSIINEGYCLSSNYDLGHETGHNFGDEHDANDSCDTNQSGCPGFFPYSYGYQDPVNHFRTIMAYDCIAVTCPRINYYSNQVVSYNGNSIGNRTADNAKSMNYTRTIIANFRATCTEAVNFSIQGSGLASVEQIESPGCLLGHYHPGATITLRALPEPGSSFVSWIGATGGSVTQFTLPNTPNVTTITAVFAQSGSLSQQGKLTPSAGSSTYTYGLAVAADGDTVIAGGYDVVSGSNSAYVFVRDNSGWVQQAELIPSKGQMTFNGVASIAISGDTVMIASNLNKSGAVYVFVRNGSTWTQQAILPRESGDAFFGRSIALSGDIAAVGAWGTCGQSCGIVHTYERFGTLWLLQSTLSPDYEPGYNTFGSPFSIDGNLLIVGTDQANNSTVYVDVYTFDHNNHWSREAQLSSKDEVSGDGFSESLQVSNNVIVVGAPYYNKGAAYIFDKSSGIWQQHQKLDFANSATINAGYHLAINNHTIVVGCPEENQDLGNSAYVYDYTPSAWILRTTLFPNHLNIGGIGGLCGGMAVAGDTVVAGGTDDGSTPAFFVFAPTQASTPTPTPTLSPSATLTLTPTSTATPTHKPDTIGIFRPSTATFYLRGSNTQGFANLTVQYGNSNSYPVVGDWTGSGVSTIGVFDPTNGQFQLRNSNTAGAADETFVLGIAGDQPFAGRWQVGAAHDGVGVFRPSNGLIYLKNELNSGFADYTMVLGIPGDVGVAGDWDGNGLSSPGVFRPNIVTFYLSDQVTNGSVFGDHTVTLGYPGDTPFAGDWIAQGHAGVGIFRPTNGLLYLKNDLSSGFADVNIVYGIPNDIPVAGHWGISSAPAPHNSVIVPNTPLPAAASATPTQPRLRLTQPGSYDG